MPPKTQRISRSDWDSLYNSAKIVYRGVFLSVRSGTGAYKLAVVVPKKHIKLSVDRHEMKRVIYNQLKPLKNKANNQYYMVFIQKKGTLADYVADIKHIL